MSRDLEEQLDEMGPEYRAVVARLKDSATAEDLRLKTRDGRRGFASKVLGLKSYLVAASLLILVGVGVVFLRRQDLRHETEDMSFAPREYRASIPEMIATQNPDGSWKNDFLTRRNAAKLKGCDTQAARIAYKKAARYLNAKGLAPMGAS